MDPYTTSSRGSRRTIDDRLGRRDREIRRYAGAVGQGIRRLDFGVVVDPRASCSTPLHTLVTAIMLGLAAGRLPDDIYAQRQGDKALVRTMTCALTSAKAAVCTDAVPVEGRRGEMSACADFFCGLVEVYGHTDLFEFVTGDAGMNSEKNAALVDAEGYGYVFAIKEDQPTLIAEAERLLARRSVGDALAESVDVLSNRKQVRRRVWLTDEMAGYHGWNHLRLVVRVQSELIVDGDVTSTCDRYYVTNATRGRFTGTQWLRVIRGHWGGSC